MAGATIPMQQRFSQPVRVDVYTVVTNINTNNTNTNAIVTGPGVLGEIVINTKGTSSNVLTLYDSLTASGTKIATIDTTAQIGAIVYNAALTNGLSCNLANGVAADITILCR